MFVFNLLYKITCTKMYTNVVCKTLRSTPIRWPIQNVLTIDTEIIQKRWVYNEKSPINTDLSHLTNFSQMMSTLKPGLYPNVLCHTVFVLSYKHNSRIESDMNQIQIDTINDQVTTRARNLRAAMFQSQLKLGKWSEKQVKMHKGDVIDFVQDKCTPVQLCEVDSK